MSNEENGNGCTGCFGWIILIIIVLLAWKGCDAYNTEIEKQERERERQRRQQDEFNPYLEILKQHNSTEPVYVGPRGSDQQ